MIAKKTYRNTRWVERLIRSCNRCEVRGFTSSFTTCLYYPSLAYPMYVEHNDSWWPVAFLCRTYANNNEDVGAFTVDKGIYAYYLEDQTCESDGYNNAFVYNGQSNRIKLCTATNCVEMLTQARVWGTL